MLNVGLIGLGKMGKYHLNLYSDIRDVKLMGICDANPDVVNELSGKQVFRAILIIKKCFLLLMQ